jgi:hypothetical protein
MNTITWRLWMALALLTAFGSSDGQDPTLTGRYESPIVHGARYHKTGGIMTSWEEATRSMTWCSRSAHLYSGRFYNTSDGELLYEPEGCKLRRFSAAEARVCLANKTLLFIGDSISRYHYMSLAHLLAKGVYPQRYADDGAANVCIMITEHYPTWADYFSKSSSQLASTSPALVATEECNCARPSPMDHRSHENRFLSIRTTGEQPSFINIIYNNTCIWPSISAAPYLALKEGLLTRDIDVAVVNIGAWLGNIEEVLNMTQIAEGFEPMFALPKQLGKKTARMFWRSMSDGVFDRQKIALQSHVLTIMARFHGWSVLDANHLTRQALRQGAPLRWDILHFLPLMYDQWNDVLLHELCNL